MNENHSLYPTAFLRINAGGFRYWPWLSAYCFLLVLVGTKIRNRSLKKTWHLSKSSCKTFFKQLSPFASYWIVKSDSPLLNIQIDFTFYTYYLDFGLYPNKRHFVAHFHLNILACVLHYQGCIIILHYRPVNNFALFWGNSSLYEFGIYRGLRPTWNASDIVFILKKC